MFTETNYHPTWSSDQYHPTRSSLQVAKSFVQPFPTGARFFYGRIRVLLMSQVSVSV